MEGKAKGPIPSRAITPFLSVRLLKVCIRYPTSAQFPLPLQNTPPMAGV